MELNTNNWPTQDVLERAVEMAFEINDAMGELPSGRERGAFVRKMFDAAELVWAVWRDPEEEDVFHFEIVKGAASVGSLATTAFLVPDGATAEKMRAGLGNGAITPTHTVSRVIQ
jgi:hypothetical protein